MFDKNDLVSLGSALKQAAQSFKLKCPSCNEYVVEYSICTVHSRYMEYPHTP